MRKMMILMMIVVGFILMGCGNPMGTDMTDDTGVAKSVEGVEIVQVRYSDSTLNGDSVTVYEESIDLEVEIYYSNGDVEADTFTYTADKPGVYGIVVDENGLEVHDEYDESRGDTVEVDFVAVDSIEVTSEDVFEVNGKNRAYTENITFDIEVTFEDEHSENIVAEYPMDTEDIGETITFDHTQYGVIDSVDVNIQDWRLVETWEDENDGSTTIYTFDNDGTYNYEKVENSGTDTDTEEYSGDWNTDSGEIYLSHLSDDTFNYSFEGDVSTLKLDNDIYDSVEEEE